MIGMNLKRRVFVALQEKAWREELGVPSCIARRSVIDLKRMDDKRDPEYEVASVGRTLTSYRIKSCMISVCVRHIPSKSVDPRTTATVRN